MNVAVRFSLRKLTLLFVMLAGSIVVSGKSLSVKSFSPLPFDLSASTNQKLDLNQVPGALIKIPLTEGIKDVKIEGNVIEQINDGTEVLAYITDGTKKIVIKAAGYAPVKLVFSDFGVYKLFSRQTYSLSLQITSSTAPAAATTSTVTSIHELLDTYDDNPIEEMVANANRLYADGKPAEALPLLEKAAKLGHAEALLSLGLLYEKGVSANGKWILKPDEHTAFIHVEKSATQGYVPAQKVLSRYYLTGVGVEPDRAKSEDWNRTFMHNAKELESGSVSNENKIYTGAEIMPEYPGGDTQMLKDVQANLIYPSDAQENGIQGKVVVQFVVTKDGSIGAVKVVRSRDPSLDAEAIRVVKTLKNFKPGLMNGNRVNVWYTVPITFKLQGV